MSGVRLLPGHAALRNPQTVALVFRSADDSHPVTEYVSNEQLEAAIRGDMVYVCGGVLTIMPGSEE